MGRLNKLVTFFISAMLVITLAGIMFELSFVRPCWASPQHGTPTGQGLIGPGAIFKLSPKAEGSLKECEPKAPLEQKTCVLSVMRASGASPQAISFTKRMGGDTYMTGFRKLGNVDLAETTNFFYIDTGLGDQTFLVNGMPAVFDPREHLRDMNIRTDPAYPAIVRKFPNAEIWSNGGFKTSQQLAGGGQRFTYQFPVLNGCHGCEVAGTAKIAFDFDRSGKYLGAKLLGLTEQK